MNLDKQRKKLVFLMEKAEQSISREESKKILKKVRKIARKMAKKSEI